MKYSDIKIKHIYNVIFDQVRFCEFNGKHLALVLKKNNDNQTFIVMPLTSEPNGNGVNKIKLGTISSLPTSLRSNDTYAVYNQIRTVNSSRFIALKEGNNVIESKLDDEIFYNLVCLGLHEIIYDLNQDEKINILKRTYEKERFIKAKDLAYNILKLKKEINNKEDKILSIKQEIRETLYNISYNLEQKHIDDGIKDIFDDILKDK